MMGLFLHGINKAFTCTLFLGKFGRFFDIFLILCLSNRLNFHVIIQRGQSLGHDFIAYFQSSRHHVVLSIVLFIHGDFGIFYLVVATHYINEYLVLYLCGGILWNHNRMVVDAGYDNGA